MNTAETKKQPVFEFNKVALKKINHYCTDLNQSNAQDNKVTLKIEFTNYQDIGFSIESILNSVINANEEDLKKEPIMYQNVLELSSKLVRSLPLEFLDTLLIKENWRESEFINIENL